MSRRLGASLALAGGAVALGCAAYAFITEFPSGLIVLACVLGALGAAWYGLLRRGWRRLLGVGCSAALLIAAAVLMLSGVGVVLLIPIVLAFAVSVAGARAAFKPEHSLPRAEPPRHPVLFVNPRSGDGRAERVGLVEAAKKRGLETVVLKPGEDLEVLVRDAVGRGADALAMAGGDGSQALVATIAAEHDLAYACIPSGTRNHFALDLGVDREDVIGALEALFDGGERYVDLGEVNGRVFVNNVSLGVYAEAVSQDQYREAKLRTLLETLTDTLGPEAEATELRWKDPEGAEQSSQALILVSNNAYALGAQVGSGTRPRLDEGVLGIVDFHPPAAGEAASAAHWRQLAAAELEIEADSPIPIGVDGESLLLQPPLRFRVRPRALRVRISREHPGASPSADSPRGPLSALKQLLRVAISRSSTR